MNWAAALAVAVAAWLPWGHMHADPSATLDTSTITDMREWFGVEGATAGLIAGGREL